MAGWRSPVTDIREIGRRLQLGEPDRRIARDLGVGRNTVARYREWADKHALLELATPLPEPAALVALLPAASTDHPAHEQSLVEPFRERVTALHERGVEGQAIWQLLIDEHEFVSFRQGCADAGRAAAGDGFRVSTPRRVADRPVAGAVQRIGLARPSSSSSVAS